MKTWFIKLKSVRLSYAIDLNQIEIFKMADEVTFSTKLPVNNFLLIGMNNLDLFIHDESILENDYSEISIQLITSENGSEVSSPIFNFSHEELLLMKKNNISGLPLRFNYEVELPILPFRLRVWKFDDLSKLDRNELKATIYKFCNTVKLKIKSQSVNELLQLQSIKIEDFTNAFDIPIEDYKGTKKHELEMITNEEKEFVDFESASSLVRLSLNNRLAAITDINGQSPLSYKSLSDGSFVEFGIYVGMNDGVLIWAR